MGSPAKVVMLVALLAASPLVDSSCRISEVEDENPCGGTLFCDQDFSDAMDTILQMPCLGMYYDYSVYSSEDYPLRHVHQNFTISIEANAFDAFSTNDSSVIKQLSDHIVAFSITNGRIKKVPVAMTNLQLAVTMDLSNNKIDSFNLAAFSVASSLSVLNMSYNDIAHLDVLVSSASNFSVPINTIDLSHNKIRGIIKDCFPQYRTLLHLNFSYNFIEAFHESALENLSALLTLDISNNRIIELGSFLTGLVRLENLFLDHNSLTSINKNNFYNLSAVKYLNISSNHLKDIEHSSFYPLLALTQLDMSNNKINILTKSMFQNNSYLYSLDVSFNNISKIESGAFAGAHIEDLKLHNNTLAGCLDAAAFNGLYFEKLDLSDADVSELGPSLFGPNPTFQSLNFSRNVISKISSTTFRNLHLLVELDLSYNKLENIEFDTSDLTNLTYFYMNNNNIKVIRKIAFDQMSSVKIIDLSNNAIVYLERLCFVNLKQLNTLNLKKNPLITIPQQAFTGLTSCYNLDLSNTEIKTLENNTFYGMESLNSLNLSFSNLKDLEFYAFNGTGSIEFLDLSHNHIESFAINITNRKLQKVLLASNNLSSINKESFQNLSQLSILDLSANRISKIQPGSFRDCKSLSYLNLNSNNLTLLEYGVFEGLNNLNSIDLSYNSFRLFDGKLLYDLQNIRTINLDNNDLNQINFRDFSRPHVVTLSIGGNLLQCEALMSFKREGFAIDLVAKEPRFDIENVNGITCKTAAELGNVSRTLKGEMAEHVYIEKPIHLETTNRYLAAIFATLLTAMLVTVAMFVYSKFKARLGQTRTLSTSRQELSNAIELE